MHSIVASKHCLQQNSAAAGVSALGDAPSGMISVGYPNGVFCCKFRFFLVSCGMATFGWLVSIAGRQNKAMVSVGTTTADFDFNLFIPMVRFIRKPIDFG